MFKKLLVPLDGSDLAEQAVGQAVAIAKAARAELDVVFVHKPLAFDGFSDAPWNAELWDIDRKYIESVAGEISSGSSVPVTNGILEGEAVHMICQRVRDLHVDLVVMTSHGRTGLSRAWLGSVAHGVLRHSTVPVLTLQPIEGRTRDAAHHLFKRVLILVDGSAFSTEVFSAAVALAQCSDARITLLRILQPIPMISTEAGVPFAYVPALIEDPETRRLAEAAKEQLAETARRLGQASQATIDFHVAVDSHVAPAILDFARANDIDVIAMSTHGRGMSRYLVGSVADKVLRGSGVPTLLYRPVEARAGIGNDQVSAGAKASVTP